MDSTIFVISDIEDGPPSFLDVPEMEPDEPDAETIGVLDFLYRQDIDDCYYQYYGEE